MVIDVHTHFVPRHFPDMSNRPGGNRWPVMQMIDEQTGNVMISNKIFRSLTEQAWNAERRLQDMNEEGIERQVVSPMPELLSYWFESKDTLEFSRFINHQLSELIQTNPNRFYGLGMIPLQDPSLAAIELRRLKSEFGLMGVEVGSNINGRPIGDPFFTPFFEAVAAEELAIFVHPLHPIGQERLVGPLVLQAFINFQMETAFAAASLITGGILEKFPNLRILLSHGGGSFPSILPRLVHGWGSFPELRSILEKSPEEYAKKLYYDTLVYDDLTLQHVIHLFGTEQLLVGSDYPFLIREQYPGRRINSINIHETEKEQILSTNCMKFLGVD